MDNHHLEWNFPLKIVIFHRYDSHYQRVKPTKCPRCCCWFAEDDGGIGTILHVRSKKDHNKAGYNINNLAKPRRSLPWICQKLYEGLAGRWTWEWTWGRTSERGGERRGERGGERGGERANGGANEGRTMGLRGEGAWRARTKGSYKIFDIV